MKKVFISGSRHLTRLTNPIKERLLNIINQKLHVVVGDANGMDKAVQSFFHQQNYKSITIYCSGNTCRNNLGSWPVEYIEVDKGVKGRDFYTVKDKSMAKIADFGLVLWDGKSQGSYNNVNELLRQDKKSLLYYSPTKSFKTIKQSNDLAEFITSSTENTLKLDTTQQMFSF